VRPFAILVFQYVHTASMSGLFVALKGTTHVVDAEAFQVAAERTGVLIVAKEGAATSNTRHRRQFFINTEPPNKG
jgi:hypothetical protein